MQITAADSNFQVYWDLCSNPDCPCLDTIFVFLECDAEGCPVPGGQEFRARVNLSTGIEMDPPSLEEPSASTVAGFLEEGRQGLFAKLLQQMEEGRACEKRIEEYVIAPEELQQGLLVSFSRICWGEDPVSLGGSGEFSSFAVTCEGRRFTADDLYCPWPDCQCDEVTLVFLGKTVDKQGRTMTGHVFDAIVTLKGEVRILEVHAADLGGKEVARRVVRALLEEDSGLLGELRRRNEVVKEVGRRSLRVASEHFAGRALASKLGSRHTHAPVSRGVKVGRNEPCPCGSGKKFKKCCGRE